MLGSGPRNAALLFSKSSTSVSRKVPPPEKRIAPPSSLLPPVSRILESPTSSELATLKIRWFCAASMVMLLPRINKSSVISKSLELSVIVWPARLGLKTIWSPFASPAGASKLAALLLVATMASRKLIKPSRALTSNSVSTVMVASRFLASSCW